MKTAPFMVKFLPRFRWFVWGFGLCAAMFCIIDGWFSISVPIMFFLGIITYAPEQINRRLIENQRRISEIKRS